MPEIQIAVINKAPKIVGDIRCIVANNSDYTIRFAFDEMWEEGEKTVYFVRENGFTFPPAKTADDTVTVPVQNNPAMHSMLFVGVQQGSVKTSRPVEMRITSAITDMIDDDAVQPDPSMWEDILARVEYLEEHGGGGTAGIVVEDDGEGNVVIKNSVTGELVEITDDGEGNLVIGGVAL